MNDPSGQVAEIDGLRKQVDRLRTQVVCLWILISILVLCVPGISRGLLCLVEGLCLLSAGYAIRQGLRRLLSRLGS